MLFVQRSHEKTISCKNLKKVDEVMYFEDISLTTIWFLSLQDLYLNLKFGLRRDKIRPCLLYWYSENNYEKIISRMLSTLHVSRQ